MKKKTTLFTLFVLVIAVVVSVTVYYGINSAYRGSVWSDDSDTSQNDAQPTDETDEWDEIVGNPEDYTLEDYLYEPLDPPPEDTELSGACCWDDGGCNISTQQVCEDLGATWDGSDSCDPNPCTVMNGEDEIDDNSVTPEAIFISNLINYKASKSTCFEDSDCPSGDVCVVHSRTMTYLHPGGPPHELTHKGAISFLFNNGTIEDFYHDDYTLHMCIPISQIMEIDDESLYNHIRSYPFHFGDRIPNRTDFES